MKKLIQEKVIEEMNKSISFYTSFDKYQEFKLKDSLQSEERTFLLMKDIQDENLKRENL